ncbi:sensor histidine kinase [Pontibacter sp. KCTC 32443]|uniref:sensor histidine kinase n=1 Tax=Pontibacter TaxID=323449 RepID=UPI00164E3539|nr:MULTISPECIES: sensor histidine kinase [Pontibacter]MBC5774672.1 sensor histidine kinase [Pontibacter sp. KCTC 32443]
MLKILQPLFIITPVLLALAIAIIGFVFKYQRRMLEHQENLRQLQEAKQRQLLDATLQAQESERRRVARDLHDEVGVMLALVKLNVHQLTAQTENIERGHQTKNLLEEVITSVRHISHDLMPASLEKAGLSRALEGLKNFVPAVSGLQLYFTSNDPEKRLSPRTELFLYRVVQELLNNTLKHARASNIKIDLNFEVEQLQVNYEDDGIGFDHEPSSEPGNDDKQGKGLGLMNIQARVELLDGTLDYTSAPAKGTKAFISVPIS